MKTLLKTTFLFFLLINVKSFSQEIALLKYNGGGDWYANPTSLPNLIKYSNQTINTKIRTKPATVEPGSPDIFGYPFVHMTGHGNVVFSDAEIVNLKNYLLSGGFLHVDDNYGSRMWGWLVPPVSGDYTFWITADDMGEFWLSIDDEPANKVLECYTPGPVSRYFFSAYSEQKSEPVTLEAGLVYYFEVRVCANL